MGLHKTATSSFQETCRVNSEILEKQGYSYPIFSSDQYRNIITGDHSPAIFSLFTEQPELFYKNIWAGIEDYEILNNDYLL